MSVRSGAVPRRGRPPIIDRDRIVETAAAMNPETLTMAAVAASLGVSTSALYRWVADRETLLDLVGERTATHLLPEWEPAADTWREWLADWAHRARRELSAVPGHAVRVLTGKHCAAGHTRLEESAVRAFRAAGAGLGQAHQLWYVFSTGVVAWVAVEQSGQLRSGTTPMDFTTLLDVLLRGTEATIALPDRAASARPQG